MRHYFGVEIREGKYEPRLHATILQEGRAATGGRREIFTPFSVTWPTDGIAILVEHRGAAQVRAQPTRQRDGRITLSADTTPEIREAVAGGKRYASVEFIALKQRVTRGGVREILSALVPSAALVASPEYDSTVAEVRAKRRRRVWL